MSRGSRSRSWVWDRYGRFAGQPAIRGTVTWAVRDRRVVVVAQRGHESERWVFERLAPH
jgi:hypothetical protein